MQESDVTKMKVADLKRELKNRGLSIIGNKNELIERLQEALLDGSVDEFDELGDTILNEDEANILADDENDLLQSPTTLKLNVGGSKDDDDVLLSPKLSKKIVLKRENSFKDVEAASKLGSSHQSPELKKLKMSERNPITITDGDNNSKIEANLTSKSKLSQLSEKERLELRAKKFGQVTTLSAGENNNSSEGATSIDNLEKLKKRAERFGVVSPAVAKLDENERLLKRKQRFGCPDPSITTTENNDVWAEKARQRLERFKTAPTTTTVSIEEKQ